MSPLPIIQTTGIPLREQSGNAMRALLRANDPPEMFVRSGRLCRVRQDEHGRAMIEEHTTATLRHRLARVADFVTVQAHNQGRHTFPPEGVVADLLAYGEWPEVPVLEGVTEVPVLRSDGSILTAPGYDAETRLVYRSRPGATFPAVDEHPATDAAAHALAVVEDLLADFPWENDASRANFIALMLTPVVRPAFVGVVPMALLDKPKRGTGASLLASLVQLLATGTTTDLMTAPRDEDEWRKKITAAIRTGTPIMFFDNVEELLSSAQLAAALTSTEWKDRILGASDMVSAPNRATWMATGNNLRVGGDLGRRSYWIRLDAKVARPWERTGWRHPDLLAHVRAHRERIIAALLVLARRWFLLGCPPADHPILGGFEPWAQTVGGILGCVGVNGFLGNQDALYAEVDDEEPAWEAFFSAWHGAFGDSPVTVSMIADEAKQPESTLRRALPPDLADALSSEIPGKGTFNRKLGNALRRHHGAVFGALRVEKLDGVDRATNTARWVVFDASGVRPSAGPGLPGLPGLFRSERDHDGGHKSGAGDTGWAAL